jgi:hypothetical protein
MAKLGLKARLPDEGNLYHQQKFVGLGGYYSN